MIPALLQPIPIQAILHRRILIVTTCSRALIIVVGNLLFIPYTIVSPFFNAFHPSAFIKSKILAIAWIAVAEKECARNFKLQSNLSLTAAD